MFDPKILDEMTSHLTRLLPEGVLEIPREVEKNARAFLSAALTQLDIVPREAFDVQQVLLEQALDRIATLEKRVADLSPREPVDLQASGKPVPDSH